MPPELLGQIAARFCPVATVSATAELLITEERAAGAGAHCVPATPEGDHEAANILAQTTEPAAGGLVAPLRALGL